MISAFDIDHGIAKRGIITGTVKAVPQEAKRLHTSARLGKQGRLKRREDLGRAFKSTGGRPEQSESRPGLWLPQSRKAWERGYHSA